MCERNILSGIRINTWDTVLQQYNVELIYLVSMNQSHLAGDLISRSIHFPTTITDCIVIYVLIECDRTDIVFKEMESDRTVLTSEFALVVDYGGEE
jgi:hypothetical protein